MVLRDSWQEVAQLSIQRQGDANEVSFAMITDTFTFEMGEYGVEGRPLINGGRNMLRTPEEDGSFSFECYPLEVGTFTGTTGLGVFDLKYGKAAAADPQIVTSKITGDKVRVTALWTEDILTKINAAVATSADKAAMRLSIADVYITNVEPDFSEKDLKFTVTGKYGVRDRAGNSNFLAESTKSSAPILTALSNYTTTVKFR